MSKIEVFLSHKAKDGALAKHIRDVLAPLLPDLGIFLSEEIDKSKDFRDEILKKLAKARFFILLYTDPSEDWSWCFFEAGAFHSARPEKGARKRQIYCLHTKDSLPPGAEIVVEGYQAKDGSNRAVGKNVTFTDGRRLFLGLQMPGADAEKK